MNRLDRHRPTFVVGLGCQRGCPASALRKLIERSLQDHDVQIENIGALASIDLKRNEPGLLALAEQLNVPVHFFSAEQLAAYDSQLSYRSQVAFKNTGCYGVAESAALAAASQFGSAELLITRQKSAVATFALTIGRPADKSSSNPELS